jgi:hypothetical protein
VRLPNGLQIFHEFVCVGSASRSRGAFPVSCYRDLQHFAVHLLSSGDPAEERVHVVVYSQGTLAQRRPATRKLVVQRLYASQRVGSKPSVGQTRERSGRQ